MRPLRRGTVVTETPHGSASTRKGPEVPGLGRGPDTLTPLVTPSLPNPEDKEIPDTLAVRFARHAMGVAAYGHFKEVPPIWAAFVKVLEDRFMPSDIKNRLTEELGRLKMV